MPSRGSPRVTIRLEPLLLHEIKLAMESANHSRREAPYTISDWIKACVIDRLKHLERAKKCRRKEAAETGSERSTSSKSPKLRSPSESTPAGTQ